LTVSHEDKEAFATPDVEGDPGGEPPSPEPMEWPPELSSVPDKDLREILDDATEYAFKKTKSLPEADVLVSDVFHKLTTTRRWDPTKTKSLRKYVLFVVKSEFLNRMTSAEPEREELAHEGFHREFRPDHSPSAEDGILERAHHGERHAESRTELDELEVRIAKHPLMPRVLECKSEGMKPGEIARSLGVPERDVYAALKLLKYHLTKIREGRGGGGKN